MVDSMTIHEIHELLYPHDDLRGVLQYMAKEGSNTTISVMIFLQQAVRSSFIGSFREPGSFSVKDFLRAKGSKTLFCEYDVASGDAVAPIFRTLIEIDGSVIGDWDITGLQVGQCIVALPDGPPYLFAFAAPGADR